MEEKDYARERQRMVEQQIVKRGLADGHLLSAFVNVPRHWFVPEDYRYLAYDDGPLPIGHGQTISQPYIVALMTSLLNLQGEERVLEVGTGSGYQAAILGYLTQEVHTIEFVPELAQQARQTIWETGLRNVFCHVGDGSGGWPPEAPYNGILVTAAAPVVPQVLLEQLTEAGKLVLPVGGRGLQELEVWERVEKGFTHQVISGVSFVPLRGKHGWDEAKW